MTTQQLLSSLAARKSLQIVTGIMLMFIAAQVRIPIWPVPITLQSSAALILALCYKKSEALAAMAIYMLLGIIGLPVFSNFNGGMDYFFSYTCGYIVGMFLSIYVVASMREYFGDNSWLKLLIYGLVGTLVTLASGVTYIAIYLGLEQALVVGLYPLLLSGAAKALFTSASVQLIRQNLQIK